LCTNHSASSPNHSPKSSATATTRKKCEECVKFATKIAKTKQISYFKKAFCKRNPRKTLIVSLKNDFLKDIAF